MSHSGSSCYWEYFLPALLLLTATFIICYFSGLQLGFPSSSVEICLRLAHAKSLLLGLVPGPWQPWLCHLPAWHLSPPFSTTKPLMKEFHPPCPTQPGPPPFLSHTLCAFILCRVLPFLPCFPAEPKHLPVRVQHLSVLCCWVNDWNQEI